MTHIRFPLKDHLQDPVDEAALHRIAQALDSRRRVLNIRRRTPLVVAGGMVAAAAIVAAFVGIRRDAGPLRLADGRDLGELDAAREPTQVALSDGSRIALSPGAHLEPLESSGTSFWASVTEGRADFEVHPGGPRHWIVECGLATVEVVGTSFTCDRTPGRLRIEVRHGVVLVRGERVPNRARRLTAGEVLDLTDDVEHRELSPAPLDPVFGRGSLDATPAGGASEEGAQDSPLEPKRVDKSAVRNPGDRSWIELAQHGRHGEAFATLGSAGVRRESKRLGVNDLLALADVARLSGHPAEAVVPLQRIIDEFATDPHAPLAAFALGRLELDSLGHAHAAVSSFRKALALGVPRSLREDVRARLVEACARSGDAAAARRAADDYFSEFPNGRHARAIEGWLRLR